ncbi:conserved hypothetical protein [uncultured Desulfobacterium sp.]|uniref:Response regulatory domain-containing protein n=1 Tax=uncultured Desulfobacterium sp. TaxID=201089 RepID=A0A445MRP1_9BACT|nr:conserved hypothetical protein [uncultured Desulfobacterium sp.]
MLKLLIVTTDRDKLFDFASALLRHEDVELAWADSGRQALDMVSRMPVDLVVTDENLGDMTGLKLALRLLSINPMVNCSAISSLSEEEFHEASEGLGLLAHHPPQPKGEDAEGLLTRLREIKNLMKQV